MSNFMMKLKAQKKILMAFVYLIVLFVILKTSVAMIWQALILFAVVAFIYVVVTQWHAKRVYKGRNK